MNTQLIIQIIIVAIIVVAFFIWLAWQIKKKGLKEFVIDAILEAESLYKKGQNSEKMQSVIDKLKAILESTKIGKILMIFITEEDIQKFIQSVFDNLKKALDYMPTEKEQK